MQTNLSSNRKPSMVARRRKEAERDYRKAQGNLEATKIRVILICMCPRSQHHNQDSKHRRKLMNVHTLHTPGLLYFNYTLTKW